MASSFPLNMCITMEAPVRYDTYHAIGVPSFIVDFGTVNEPSASAREMCKLRLGFVGQLIRATSRQERLRCIEPRGSWGRGPRILAPSDRVFILDRPRVDVFPWCNIGIARGWRKCLLVIIAMFLLHRRQPLSGSL